MPNLIELLTLESHKLMLATSPHLKRRFKEKIKKVLEEPQLTHADVIKAMKKIERELDLSLKSHPDAKNAMVGALIVYAVLLRNEVREMVLLARQPHQELSSLLSVIVLATLLQPLLKRSDALQLEKLEDALRRIH